MLSAQYHAQHRKLLVTIPQALKVGDLFSITQLVANGARALTLIAGVLFTTTHFQPHNSAASAVESGTKRFPLGFNYKKVHKDCNFKKPASMLNIISQ